MQEKSLTDRRQKFNSALDDPWQWTGRRSCR